MKLKSFFLTVIIISIASRMDAQKPIPVSDSLWCAHLNEIIKCASTDIITDRIGKDIVDSEFIAPFKPALRLSNSSAEYIKKEYGKVNYECYVYSGEKIDEKMLKHFEQWHQKIKACLNLWEDARLKNTDTSITSPDDYFFTNSEDETSVRLDIVKDKGYHIRLRIF